MEMRNDTAIILAVRRALNERQLDALRDWLGEDHELLRQGPVPPARATGSAETTLTVPPSRPARGEGEGGRDDA